MEGNPVLETEICHNCKKEVPQQNYLMHVAHCARNVCICQICNEPVAKSRLQEHKEKEHKQIQCPACKEKIESSYLRTHKAEKCPKRMSICQHCELELPYADLQDHIYHCGARTDRCEECGELVMLKYQKIHRESNHGFIKLNDEPGPTPSWETNTTKPTPNASSRKQNGTPRVRFETPLEDIRPLRNTLPSTVTQPEELTPCQKEIEREEREGRRNSIEVPLRDLPRTFVPAYDASDDLRAKVKLARHDLNNIKHSVLAGEERVKQLTRHARSPVVGPDLIATGRRPPPAFSTNLVPYEKNKSFEVNALPLGSQPEMGPSGGSGACFNYLGAPTGPPVQQNGVTSIQSGPKAPLRPLASQQTTKGAVPRTHKKNKAPAPPLPTTKNILAAPQTKLRAPPTPKDEIPCEFCGKMIDVNGLVLHETACRPDLAQLKAPGLPVAGAAPPSPEVELPCEFCCSLIPASRLLSHQALCDV